MPPGPLIKSPRLQTLVIGVVMTLLLAASLGAAHWVSQHRSARPYPAVVMEAGAPNARVGELAVWIPPQFTTSPLPTGINLPAMHVMATYTQPDLAGNVLIIGRLQSQLPRSATRALHEVLAAYSGQQTVHQVQALPFRTRTMLGLSFIGVREQDQQGLSHQVLNLLTEDGQNYWLIGIIGNAGLDAQSRRRLLSLDHLVSVLSQTATTPRYTAAIDEDFTEAGLPVLDQGALERLGLQAMVDTGQTDAGPILLRGVSTGPALQWVRVLGMPDAGSSDPADPLSPRSLLLDQHRLLTQREPTDNELWWGMAANADAWRLSFPLPQDSGTNLGLVWELWYVRWQPGKGLLIETRCEAPLAGATQALVPRLVDALRAAGGPGDDSQAQAGRFQLAVQRGELVSAALRAQLPLRHKTQTIYGVVRVNGKVVRGYTERLSVHPGDPMPLAGRALLMEPGDGQQILSNWSMSRDGTRRQEITKVIEPAGDGQRLRRQEVVTLADNRLSLQTGDGNAMTESWSWPVRPGLVTAAEYWPYDSMNKLGPGPVLIWLSRHNQPPTPHWATQTPTTGPDRTTSGWRVTLRPIMAMDGEVMVFDASGELKQAVLRTPLPVASGTLPVFAQMVDRQALLTEVPEMGPVMAVWEKQTPTVGR